MLIWLIVSICLAVAFPSVLLGIFIYNCRLNREKNMYKDIYGNFYYYEGKITSIVCGFLGFISLVNLGVCVGYYHKYNSECNELIANIMSVNKANGVEGSFALGSGIVKDVQYYFYYHSTEKGVKLGKIEAEHTYVIETDDRVPSIYKIKELHSFNEYYNLYVPCGTIITTFVLS